MGTEQSAMQTVRAKVTTPLGEVTSKRDIAFLARLLVRAVHDRAALTLQYDPGVREIEPHAVGYGTDGQLLLRAWQRVGASASGEHSNWKLFRIDRIGDLVGWGPQFDGPRPGFKRGDRAMTKGILAEL